MALPPCHVLFQFYVQDGELSCQLYQRSSCDLFPGCAVHNIASKMIRIADMCRASRRSRAGDFVHTFGDLHLYKNHLDQARSNSPRMPAIPRLN